MNIRRLITIFRVIDFNFIRTLDKSITIIQLTINETIVMEVGFIIFQMSFNILAISIELNLKNQDTPSL